MKLLQGNVLGAQLRMMSVFAAFFLMSDVEVLAQTSSDSIGVTVYYPCGGSSISKMPGNMLSLSRFILQLDSIRQSPSVKPVSLFVTSSASPEGSVTINRKLSHERNRAVIDYLTRHSEAFRTISGSLECKFHEQTNNHQLGKMPLSAYPSMRYSSVTLVFNQHTVDVEKQPSPADEQGSCPEEAAPEVKVAETSPAVAYETNTMPATSRPVLFVKTNLLYDLLTFVNASVEIPLTRRLTAEATLVYPWWRSVARHRTVQMRYVAITPRYYFKGTDDATPYTSFFAGLTAGAGKYDLQWTRRGVQGTMWHISPTFGYSHPISKRWKMEYSASVGFVQTKYTKYTQTADTPYGEIKVKDYPWVQKVLNTVLPTSLSVSLVYSFNKTKQARHHER